MISRKRCAVAMGVAMLAQVLAGAAPCEAGLDWGRPATLAAAAAAADGEARDIEPQIGTDGAGVWVAVWESENTAFGVTPGNRVLMYSRSIDDGASWSDPTVVRPGPVGSEGFASLATDGLGVWVLTWSDDSILSSTSTDNGATWGPVVTISPYVFISQGQPSVATDGSGVWIVAWTSEDTLGDTIGSDEDILSSRSQDDGATWTAPAVLNTTAFSDVGDDAHPRLVAGPAGTWGVVWTGLLSPRAARSTDGGLTWEAPVVLGHSGSLSGGTAPDLATDGAGNWVAVWENDFPGPGNFDHIWFARSSDNAATWSSEALLHPYFDEDRKAAHVEPRIRWLGSGRWSVVWHTAGGSLHGPIGEDFDLLTSSSRDGGVSWSSPAAMLSRAQSDAPLADDFEPVFASAAGTSIALWSFQGPPNDPLGGDKDILFATAVEDCPATARVDCLHSTVARGSSLKMRDNLGGRDLLSWRLGKVEETTDVDLGDPLTTDSLVVCLYEKVSGSPGLIAEWDVRAGGTCRGKACWQTEAGAAAFKDGGLEQGSVKSLTLRAGAAGKGSVRLRIKGAAVALPRLPLDTAAPVRIQLINLGSGACWEGVHDQASRNDASRFGSTSD